MDLLPYGYTLLEYIQSSGTQYIDSGYVPNQDTRVYAECVIAISSAYDRTYQFVAQGGNYRTDYNNNIINITDHDYGTNKFSVNKDKNVTNLNGAYSVTQTYASFSCPGNMYIFATNYNGAVYGWAAARLYSMQIYTSGTLVRDFIPCKSKEGVVGLYDTVGGAFYGNAGSGAFLAGPVLDIKAPNTWYEDDIPTASQMAQHAKNVSVLRSAVKALNTTPEAPESMRGLDYIKANNIEQILLDMDEILRKMPAADRHCGVSVCGNKGVIA